MNAIISNGDYTASVQLPVDRRQLAGALSYLGKNHASAYDIKYNEESDQGLSFTLDCRGAVENAIAKAIPTGFRFHTFNDTIALMHSLPYQSRREFENTVKVEGLASYEQLDRMLTEASPQSVTTKYYCPLTIQVWEMIVEREFFDRVQAEYARRNAKKKVTYNGEEAPQKSKYSSKYALTELLVCGDCGCPYRRCTWSKNGQKKIVWRCTTRLEYGKSKCSDSPTMEEEALHRAILKALSSLVENKDEVKDELKVALGNVLIDTGTDICIAHLEAQLKEQENDMMRVVRICAERGNQKEFEGEFKRINANITELHQIIEVEKTKIRPTLDIESRLDRLFEQITAASADMENFENSLIRQLVAQVRVESAEELTIILHNGFRTTAKI